MRYLETRKARIEIIPMIDIMLFLLVFFAMLTLRMIPSSGHVTKLPTSSTAVAIPHPKLLVEINPDGSLQVENHTLTPAQLTELLHQRDSSKTAVTIAGSDTSSLQQVMTVIDAIKAGGATEVGLATRTAAGK
ncbi:biopolymer transporter ExbD [Sideroxydans sp. CL21]|uniref:ExbD/TolR family protein n=1 Tax=Sideroxydans sp. CL21 TaxID=2600596 RepID=UPI0024BBF2CA|nr:biopolymer transporter ExbD [Sideroxydans sp. CL21]